MSQAQLPNELATFLENWTTDPNNAKDAFVRFKDFLLTTPDVRFDFKARPGVSYSLRAANAKNDERPLFVLVDVVDDEPEARWLSVCFYADMVNDPDELGDFVPSGLMGKDVPDFSFRVRFGPDGPFRSFAISGSGDSCRTRGRSGSHC